MKTRPIVGVELKKVQRYQPKITSWRGHTSMVPRNNGGYVPYTDYCLNVSKLKDKIYELETRLMNLKRFGKAQAMMRSKQRLQ